jgi:hypothetical protein
MRPRVAQSHPAGKTNASGPGNSRCWHCAGTLALFGGLVMGTDEAMAIGVVIGYGVATARWLLWPRRDR